MYIYNTSVYIHMFDNIHRYCIHEIIYIYIYMYIYIWTLVS